MTGPGRPALSRPARLAAIALAALAVLGVAGWAGLAALDRAWPPPLEEYPLSVEVVDKAGALLRPFATAEGRWRMAVELDDIDPRFIDMLLAYEDKRFFAHPGVDPVAMLRAAGQLIANGGIVSGGSTLTMQLARLLEPRAERTVTAKLLQMARALQIERRLSKREILKRYLTLAPYGGNMEGVRAAALAWFGKKPRRLSVAEAALLVALPQAPEARRPDRHRAAARAARDRVLARMAKAGIIEPREAERARAEPVPAERRAMPALAAHAARDAVEAAPEARRHRLTIRREVQGGLEAVAREAANRLDSKVSVALVMAEARTGAILASVGSPDFLDARRDGWIDMTRVERSPGSTLKPFIYGLAFEEGLIAQETLIEDRPANFGGYRPRNFDRAYQGDVSVREALQLSLNVPAIKLLDAVGPARLAARFRRAGVTVALPPGERPGLAIGLGGVGLTLGDLVQLYTGLANSGVAGRLHVRPDKAAASPGTVLNPGAAWQVADILADVAAPAGAPGGGIAYKTGTSYGYRDAWSVGFDGRHVLGVWVGRPDGGSAPDLSGYETAAPILFEAFRRSGLGTVPLPRPPAGAFRTGRSELPVTLRRFVAPGDLPEPVGAIEPAPAFAFPPDGARVELGASGASAGAPLVMKLQGGRPPFRLLADGRPIAEALRTRTGRWRPEGTGFSTLTVVDAAGRAASVKVFVE